MTPSQRQPLTRDRVIRAAVSLADREGLDALTMRRLGTELGVEAMSLYKHVPGKEQILDGVVEAILDEIEAPLDTTDWREAMRRRAHSARSALRRHAWAIGLLEKRGTRGPTAQAYLDSVLGTLRSGGLSLEDSAHAFWLLDSFVYGHVLQEVSTTTGPDPGADREVAAAYPHLAELTAHAREGHFDVDREFDFGLDLILDALERRATTPPHR